MKRGKVVIIPDEEQILEDKFEQDILDDEYHVKGYQKFSDDNNLGLNFRDDESHRAGLSIAELGHFNYKTEDDGMHIVESRKGFLPLKNMLPIWIDEKMKEYEKQKK